MKNLRHIFYLCILIPALASAQKVFVGASKQRILLGEPFNLVLKAFVPAGKQQTWFQIDSIPNFEILDRSKVDSLREGNDFIVQQTLTLTSWDSGSRMLPSFILPGTSERTRPLKVEVSYTSPWDPNKDYNPVKDIIEVPVPQRSTWWWYVALGLLLLLLLILIFPKEKKPKTKKKAVVNAYEKALAELKLLQQQAANTETKAWYTSLTNTFKNYLYHKKEIESHAKTSADLAVYLREEHLDKNTLTALSQTLRLSDAVKFAKYEPTSLQKEESIQTIKGAIQKIEGKA